METLKDSLIKFLEENGFPKGSYRIKYFPISPYQKRRYKPEFWEEECWLYPKEVIKHEKIVTRKGQQYRLCKNGVPVMESESGLCITSNDFKDKDYMATVLYGAGWTK